MKLIIKREALLKSLNHVQGVVEKRNTIPILSNILISATDADVNFTATDLDISIIENNTAIINKKGSITAPAHLLYDIVRKLPDNAQISIEKIEETRINIYSGHSQFTLQALSINDFPNIYSGKMSHNFIIQESILKYIIEKTRFAISTEETRYYLNGIYLHTLENDNKKNKLLAVATDGHRLAKVAIQLPDGASKMPSIIIPRKTINELYKLLNDSTKKVTISVSDNKIEFHINKTILTSKLIDGNYPDYSQVIPKNNNISMTAETKLLTKAIDRVSTITNTHGRAIKLKITKNTLILEVNNPDSGYAKEKLIVEYNDLDYEIGFNAKYMLDVLNQLKGKNVIFLFNKNIDPVLVKDLDNKNTIYILMPMRV